VQRKRGRKGREIIRPPMHGEECSKKKEGEGRGERLPCPRLRREGGERGEENRRPRWEKRGKETHECLGGREKKRGKGAIYLRWRRKGRGLIPLLAKEGEKPAK